MLRDLFFVSVLGAFFLLGLRRPFLFIPAYIYADLIRPQYLTYWALNSVPVSQILFFCAFGFWGLSRHKGRPNWGGRQSLMLLLFVYCGISTIFADFPVNALTKWDWVWKVGLFALFLPLTLVTRLRFEAVLLVSVLSIGTNAISSGIKTLLSGSRYGSASMLVDGNSGVYESSAFACIAIAIIPLLFSLLRAGTVFPSKSRLVQLYGIGLIFACLIVPVATEARTGLVCLFMLGLLLMRFVRHRFLYLVAVPLLIAAAVPLLPASFLDRMETITTPKSDNSASTRLAVWRWTLDYTRDHPFGGGFDAYLGNQLHFDLTLDARLDANNQSTAGTGATISQKGRAFHSAYFEMLGEQGWPGLGLWLMIHALTFIRLEQLIRRHRAQGAAPDPWLSTMALGVQQAHLIYLTGALFVGIAFNPFAFNILGLGIALTQLARQRHASANPNRAFELRAVGARKEG